MTLVLPEQWVGDVSDPAELAARCQRNFEAIALEVASSRAGPTVYTPTYVNGWTAQGGAFPSPYVWRHGMMATIAGVFNGLGAAAVQAFTLPVGFRPNIGAGLIISAPLNYYVAGARYLGTCYVNQNGVVSLYANNDAFGAASDYTLNMTFAAA